MLSSKTLFKKYNYSRAFKGSNCLLSTTECTKFLFSLMIDGKEHCFNETPEMVKKCYLDFQKGEKMYIEKVKNGEKLSPKDVCR